MVSMPFASFPEENIDPKKKEGKDWLKKYAQAALYSYGNLPIGAIGLRSRDIYDKNKRYALGRQPVEKYKRIFNNGEDGQNRLLVTDWSIRPEIKKLRRIITALVEQLPFKVQINPVDDLAKDEIEEELLKAEAKLLARQAVAMQGGGDLLNLPTLQLNEGEPEDFEELSIKELGIRHKTAMEVEMVVQLVLNANNYEDLVSQMVEDSIDCGVVALRDDTLPNNTIGVRRIDPRDLIMSYCRKPDFSDWKYVAELNRVQASQIIAMTNGQVTKTDLETIYKMGQSAMSQWAFGLNLGYWGDSYSEWYNRGILYVLDIEIRSTDKVVLEGRKLSSGNMLYKKIDPTKKRNKDNTYEEKNIENIYCAKWIVGTDIIYDYGKKKNTKRDKLNESCVKSSFHIAACDFYDMKATSRIDELIPYADAIQLATYRLQHALNTVVPTGYEINFDALEAVDLGAGASKLTPKDILDLFFERGILLSRTSGIDGKNQVQAIRRLEGGVGNEIQEFWTLITQTKQMMRESLGLNDLTDGSTPNARTLTEIAKAAASGTNNALSDLFKMQRKIIKSLTESIVIRTQDIIKSGNDKYLVGALGTGTVKFLKNIKDVSKYLYSVQIEENPSQDDVISLQEQIKIAQANGDVNIADILMLDNMDNVKQKQSYLAYKVKKNRALKQQEAIEMQKQNGEIQVQSAQAAEDAKRQTLMMEYDLKIKYETTIKDLELRNLEVSKQYDLEARRIDASGRVESAEVQADGRDIANKRDNLVKVATAEKEVSKEILDIEPEFKSTVTPQTADMKPLDVQQKFNFLPDELQEQEMAQQEMPQEEMMMPMEEGMMPQEQMPMPQGQIM